MNSGGKRIQSIDLLNYLREAYRKQIKYWGFAEWAIDKEKSIENQNLTGYNRLIAYTVYIYYGI